MGVRNSYELPLLIFSSCTLRYSLEVRMYALAAMFVLLAYFSLYKVLKGNKIKYWCFFVLASLGAAYTHYYALLSVAFFYITLITVCFYKREFIKRTVFTCVLTVIAYLPWLFYGLLGAFTRTSDNWWLQEPPSLEDLIVFVFDYNLLFIAFLVVICAFFVKFKKNSTLKKSSSENSTSIISLETIWIASGLLALIGTIAVGYGLSYAVSPFFLERYLFPLAPVVFLIFAYCLAKLKLSKVICFVILATYICFRAPVYYQDFVDKKIKNTCTSFFLDTVKPAPNAQIITNNKHLYWTLIDYYYPNNRPVYHPNLLENLDAVVDTNSSLNHESWLFWFGELSTDEQNLLLTKYDVKQVINMWFADGWYRAYKLVSK